MPRALILPICVLAACGVDDEGSPPGHGGFRDRPAPVVVATSRSGALAIEWRLLGEARSTERARLAAGAAGEVRRVTVREGDRVTRGQVLLELDASVAAASVQAAVSERRQGEAEHAQAGRDATRLANAGRDLVPGAVIEQADSRVEALGARRRGLRASELRAQASLAQHQIVAPFDGVVAARAVDPGDWVNPGDSAIDLVSDTGVEILVNAPRELLLALEPGHPAALIDGAEHVSAQVVGIVRALDPRTRTARVRIAPDRQPGWLLAGSVVDVLVSIEREREGAVIVPRDALVAGVVGHRVVTVVDGKAEPVRVELIGTSATEALVFGPGLGPDATVVIRGNERLRPDQNISIQSPAPVEQPEETPDA